MMIFEQNILAMLTNHLEKFGWFFAFESIKD